MVLPVHSMVKHAAHFRVVPATGVECYDLRWVPVISHSEWLHQHCNTHVHNQLARRGNCAHNGRLYHCKWYRTGDDRQHYDCHLSSTYPLKELSLISADSDVLCMCIGYCSLKQQTRLDLFPIPCVADLFDQLDKATVFSSIDLSHDYH